MPADSSINTQATTSLLAKLQRAAPDLSPKELQLFSTSLTTKTLKQGETLINEGDSSQKIGLLLSGRLAVSRKAKSNRSLLVGWITPGELFGDLAALLKEPHSVTVIAHENSEIGECATEQFFKILADCPECTLRLLKLTARRLVHADEQRTQLIDTDLRARLLQHFSQCAHINSSGERVVNPVPTHDQLAHLLGVKRESLTRALKTLRLSGEVEQRKGELVLRADRS